MKKMIVHSTLPPNPGSPASACRTVLCVDDSQDMLEICQTVLEAGGYRVLTALNGIQALDLLRQHTVDAAVVDNIMPGMNGLTLAREIKAAFPAVLIVMYSSALRENEDHPSVDFFLSKGKGPLALRNLLSLRLQDSSRDRSE